MNIFLTGRPFIRTMSVGAGILTPLLLFILTLGTAFADDDTSTAQITPSITPTVAATVAATAPAKATATSTFAEVRGVYIGLGTGIDLPGTNWDPTYYAGSTTDFLLGYSFDSTWGLQLDLDEATFTGNGTNLFNFRGLIDLKCTLGGVNCQPYLLAGTGLAYQSLSPIAATTTNYDALLGFGLQFPIAPKSHLFIEAKYNFIESQTTSFGDVPITTGFWIGL